MSWPDRAALKLAAAIAAVLAAVGLSSCGSSRAPQPHYPLAMLEDDVHLLAQPKRTLQTLRSLGVGVVRVALLWNTIAPDAGSRMRPPGFDGGDPAAYPASRWRAYDAVVKEAQADGIQLDFLVSGSGPIWAAGPNEPNGVSPAGVWDPSPIDYGQFVQAVATRYSGHYSPRGATSPLPAVHFWEIWSEPNWGPSLQPQLALHPIRIVSGLEYRRLADAAWSALQRTGHQTDTVVIGNLSPRGTPTPPSSQLAARVNVASPLGFTRALYCVDSAYHPLRGNAAALVGCPVGPAGSRQFHRAHPVLFDASGYGIHPYPIGLPPTEADSTNPDTVEFSQIPNLMMALDHVQSAYGSRTQMSVYNTEYGYITNPPNPGTQYLSPRLAARYLNWAEYLTWRNPRIATTMQYGLYDPNPGAGVFGKGGFATGLIFYGGNVKQTFFAYRMPIFLPVSRASRGHTLEVWGCARPAHYAYLDTRQAQYVQIQFRPRSGQRFQPLRTVRLHAARGCYFDVDVAFPTSGVVRLRWSYPRGDQRLRDPLAPRQTTIYSRNVDVTIH